MSAEERRLILIGNSGNGKSASANTILGRKVFVSKASNQFVTRKCQFETVHFRSRKYLIVDTPTFFSEASSEDETIWELAKITGITSPGFHALIIVVKVGRFTEKEKRSFEQIVRIFGPEIYDRTIVLFTGLDNLEVDEMGFEDYVNYHITSELKHIVQKCGKRTVGFNNRADDNTRQQQVYNLLAKIESVVDKNKFICPFYNSSIYKAADEMLGDEQRRRQSSDFAKNPEDIRNEIRLDIQNEEETIEPIMVALKGDLLEANIHARHVEPYRFEPYERRGEYYREPWYLRCRIL